MEGGGNFHGGKLPPEKLLPIPQRKRKTKKKIDSRKNYLLGKM